MKEYRVKVCKDRTEWFNLDDERHREDGPAIENKRNGYKAWWLNGKLHREGAPAIERADGTKFWYLNGKLHREDGPAVEWANGDKVWYLNGERLTEEDFNKRIGYMSCEGREVEIDGKTYILKLK